MFKKLFKYATLVMFLVNSVKMNAQGVDTFREQTDIIPSVEAWRMTRYGGLTPSFYTGAMQWSLPVYVYKDYDFEIPISLDYSFDGFRVGESTGNVGLGWVLNAGGVITREVRGLRDECLKQVEKNRTLYGYYYAWKKSLSVVDQPKELLRKELLYSESMKMEDMSFIEMLRDDLPNDMIVSRATPYNERYDAEPDVFRFNFCGHSGEFRFGENGRIDVFCNDEVECDLKIDVGEMSGPDCRTFYFKITTADGCQYTFGNTNDSWEYSEGCMYKTDDPKGGLRTNNYGDQTITAWKLTSIKAPSGREIMFEYDAKADTELSVFESYTPAVERLDMEGDDIESIAPSYKEKRYSLCRTRLIKRIVLKDGNNSQNLAIFSWKERTATQDEHTAAYYIDGETILSNLHTDHRNRLLDGVVVRNGNGDRVEDIMLTYGIVGIEGVGTNRVVLSSIETKTRGKWSFDYKNVIDEKGIPQFDNYNEVDIYGYWGGYGTSDLRGRENINGGGLGEQYLCENYSFDKASTGALVRIYYPTGGNSEIEYENNKVKYLLDRDWYEMPHLKSFIKEVSGVRVKRVTDWNASQLAGRKVFEYKNGVLWRYPRVAFKCDYKKSVLDPKTQVRSIIRLRSSFYTRTGFGAIGYGQRLGYGEVIEWHQDGSHSHHEYYGWEDYPDDFYPSAINSFLSDVEPLNDAARNRLLNMFLPSTQDRSSFRGRLKTNIEYDVAGVERYKEYLTYIPDTPVVINECANLFSISGLVSRTRFKSVLRTKIVTSNALSVKTEWSCDGNGRLSKEMTTDEKSGWSKIVSYRYCGDETGNDLSACPGAIRRIVTSVKENADADPLVTDYVEFTYNKSDKSAKPASMKVYRLDAPQRAEMVNRKFDALEVIEVRRDHRLLPLQVNMPGGAYIKYTWDRYGRNVLRRTVNGEEGKTTYGWQDMIGLSSVQYPNGLSESYQYDNYNRLSSTKDSDGKLVSRLEGRLSSEINGKSSRIIVDRFIDESGSRVVRDKEYYDALGRMSYEIKVGNNSIIQPVYYDYMDRADSAAYLSYTVSNIQDIDFDTINGYDWKAAQKQWYQKEYGDGQNAFTKREYETWKGGRLLEERKPGSNYSLSEKCVNYYHDFNYPEEQAIKRFSFSMTSADSASFKCVGEWAPVTLEKTMRITEEGDTSVVYKDALGRMLLSRSFDRGLYHDTYYIRDLRDSVVVVIQPEGSSRINVGDTYSYDGEFVHNYCFAKLYDGAGRLLYSHVPGDGGVRYAYDRRGRITYSDDGLLRSKGQARYFIYDEYDRLLEEGIGEPMVDISGVRGGLVHDVSINQMFSHKESTRRLSYWTSTQSEGIPSDMFFEKVEGVVDSMDVSKERCLGSVSYEVLREITNNLGGHTRRAYWYDAKGRLVQMLENSSDGWSSRYSWKYDFVGNELVKNEQHKDPSGMAHEMRIISTYDERGRIVKSERILDGAALKTVNYEYDKLGRMQSKSGSLRESTERNMLGWVTGVKVVKSNRTLFENRVIYRYDGLVKESIVHQKLLGESKEKRVRNVYSYDHLGRFIGNRRYVNGIETEVGTEKDLDYDLNGNVIFVRRNEDGNSVDYGFVYNGNTLTLAYINPFTEMTELSFSTDTNGNLTYSGYDGMTASYNYLNLPSMVNMLTYKYLSDGTKVSVKKNDGKEYVYRGNFIYNVSAEGVASLESVSIPDGRVYCSGTPDEMVWECWNITDYLGNVRSRVRADNGMAIEISDYLPYGIRIEDFSVSYEVGQNRWYYAGKEYQDFGAHEADLIDFGARYYSPSLCRWTTLDPQAGKYLSVSSYNYCNNNPVNFVDPNGAAVYYSYDGDLITSDGVDDGKIYLVADQYLNITTYTAVLARNVFPNGFEEVGGLIIHHRFEDGAKYTVSTFETVGGDVTVTGYILEPEGPDTIESGKNKRIPEGVYKLAKHEGLIYKDNYVLFNELVSIKRCILYHIGNERDDTKGCQLPGTTYDGKGFVGKSGDKFKELQGFIKSVGVENVRTIISNKRLK